MPEVASPPRPDVQLTPAEAQAIDVDMPDYVDLADLAVAEDLSPEAETATPVDSELGGVALRGLEQSLLGEQSEAEEPVPEMILPDVEPEADAETPDAEEAPDENTDIAETAEEDEEQNQEEELPPPIPQQVEPDALDAFGEDEPAARPVLQTDASKAQPRKIPEPEREATGTIVETLNDRDRRIWEHIVDLNNEQPDGEVAEQLQGLEADFNSERAGTVISLAAKSAERRERRGDVDGAQRQRTLAQEVSALNEHIFGVTPHAA